MQNLNVVTRIGGEEIAIVLPQTDYANTYSSTAEAQRINVGDSGKWIASIVSLDVSALPGDAASLLLSDSTLFELLMNKADKGLYKAKQSGRNCVSGARAQQRSGSVNRSLQCFWRRNTL